MKDLIIVLVAFLLLNFTNEADVNPKNKAEKQIIEFFSKWRNGDSLPFTIPALDVITIPPFHGSYSGKGVKITYSSSELKLIGVNKFSVERLNVSLAALRASGSLYIPTLTIFAECYKIEGSALYLYSLKGSGKLNVALKNVTLQFATQLAKLGNGSRVVELKLDFVVKDIQATLENSSWPVNKILNSEGVKILDAYHDDIVSATTAGLVDTLDDYLERKTPAQLLDDIQTKH